MNVDVRSMRTAAELRFGEIFAAEKAKLPGGAAIAERRAAAFRRFEQQGLPHRRVEEWKYTDLRALMRDAKALAGLPDAAAIERGAGAGAILAETEARRLVVIDGAFVAKLSDLSGLEAGVTIKSMAKALAEGDRSVTSRLGTLLPTDDIAVALNTAFMGGGLVIRIAKGTVCRPIHVVFAFTSQSAAAVFTRSLVLVEDGARLTLIESHEGPANLDYQVNNALELSIGDGAHVEHVKICAEGTRALHLATLMAAIGERAKLHDLTFTTGGGLVRNQLFVRFDGADATAVIRGANLLKERQHVDTTLVVDHAVPGGTSRELFKSVLDEKSRSVFQGKIIVRPGAQKTDGKMMTQALLLSQDAESDNKPELEIFADDVQCGHGATSGALDEDLLFYLKSRGIPPKQAEALLIQAFVAEAIEGLEHEAVREALIGAAVRWLEARG
jgi:Fe-S cluster assembly protein SufD